MALLPDLDGVRGRDDELGEHQPPTLTGGLVCVPLPGPSLRFSFPLWIICPAFRGVGVGEVSREVPARNFVVEKLTFDFLWRCFQIFAFKFCLERSCLILERLLIKSNHHFKRHIVNIPRRTQKHIVKSIMNIAFQESKPEFRSVEVTGMSSLSYSTGTGTGIVS